MMTYDQRVRQRAEEFAELAYAHDLAIHDPNKALWGEHREKWVISFIVIARLSIQREAEAYRRGFIKVSGGGFAEVSICEQEL